MLHAMLAAALMLTGAQALPRAHAHNDYEHERPLLDALDHGFCSVEADIYLLDGELRVAHDEVDCVPGRTLESLYLDPLRERVRQNGGRVHAGSPAPLILLVDIKNTGEETCAALLDALEPYRDMLTEYREDGIHEGAVTVIVSGWYPREKLIARLPRLAACDGRLPHLGQPPRDYPMVSESWPKVFRWRGAGEFPENERALLERIVTTAHAAGQIVRFWGLPPGGRAWDTLYEAGVDLINTDDLAALRAFLIEKAENETEAPAESE
jgi:glycerophosphoryl diester phosphodiesterase